MNSPVLLRGPSSPSPQHGTKSARVKRASSILTATLQRTEEAFFMFHKYDADKSGGIDLNELRTCFADLGIKPTHKRTPEQVEGWLARQLEKIDLDKDGVICFDEFARHYNEVIALNHHHFEHKYDMGTVLGKGAFGTVHAARRREDKSAVAVKRVTKSGAHISLLHNEIAIWARLKHPHLLQLLDVYETDEDLLLVMERMRGGDLFTALRSVSHLSEGEAAGIARQIIDAVGYLHEKDVVHCDLKPGNILLVHPYKPGTPMQLKICDFGLSQVMQASKGDTGGTAPLHVVCGTPEYFAPELVDLSHGAYAFRPLEGYDSAVDRWALGCIIFEMLAGHPPYEAKDEQVLFYKIVENHLDFPKVFESVSKDAELLIRGLMATDPAARLTCKEALQNRWLSSEKSSGGNIIDDYVQQSRERQMVLQRKMVKASDADDE